MCVLEHRTYLCSCSGVNSTTKKFYFILYKPAGIEMSLDVKLNTIFYSSQEKSSEGKTNVRIFVFHKRGTNECMLVHLVG